MSPHIIQKGVNLLANKHGLGKKHIQYIGYTDCTMINPKSYLLQYNINHPGHEFFGSTLAYNYEVEQ